MTQWFLYASSLIVALSSQSVAAGEEVVTATKLRQLLEQKNAVVAASRLESVAASQREGALPRSFMPSLALHGGQENSKLGSQKWRSHSIYGVEANFNLFNGGRDEIKNKISSLEASRKSVQVKRVAADELDKARVLYWELISLKEEATLLKTTIEVNNLNLAAAQKRVRSGVAANSDLFEFEMKAADLKRDSSKVDLSLKGHTELLRLVLGFDESVTLTFPESLNHEHDEDARLTPSESQYEFLFKEQELLSQQFSLSANEQRRSWWPRLDAFASISKFSAHKTEAAAETNEALLGVKVSLSIPAGMESLREAQALDQEATAAKLMAEHKRRETAIHLKAELAQLKLLHDQVHETEQNIARAERYYKITQSEYARGVKNSPDVLGASDKLFDARHSRLETIRDYQVAKSHLMSKLDL
jgi:outer membrane protein TolC